MLGPPFAGRRPWQRVGFVWGQQALTSFVALAMLLVGAMTFSRSRAGITLTRFGILRWWHQVPDASAMAAPSTRQE